MKRLCAMTAVVLGLGMTSAAAADLAARPVYTKAPPVAPIYDWSGFYIGGHIGYGWADPNIMLPGGASIINHPQPNGFLGGGQVGMNWQRGPWVFGVEADASWGDLDETRICTQIPTGLTLSCRGAPKYFGTLDGRLGYAIDRTLLYVKGGAAWSHEDFTQIGITVPTCIGTPCTGSAVQWGWNVGAGIEYGLTSNWSAKLQYDFLDFDHADMVTVTNGVSANVFQITKTIQTIQLGVNYRFH